MEWIKLNKDKPEHKNLVLVKSKDGVVMPSIYYDNDSITGFYPFTTGYITNKENHYSEINLEDEFIDVDEWMLMPDYTNKKYSEDRNKEISILNEQLARYKKIGAELNDGIQKLSEKANKELIDKIIDRFVYDKESNKLKRVAKYKEPDEMDFINQAFGNNKYQVALQNYEKEQKDIKESAITVHNDLRENIKRKGGGSLEHSEIFYFIEGVHFKIINAFTDGKHYESLAVPVSQSDIQNDECNTWTNLCKEIEIYIQGDDYYSGSIISGNFATRFSKKIKELQSKYKITKK